MKCFRLPYEVEAIKFDGTNVSELTNLDDMIKVTHEGVGFWDADGYYVDMQPGDWVIKEDGYFRLLHGDDEFYKEYRQ